MTTGNSIKSPVPDERFEMTSETTQPLFHGRFIPNDPNPLPLPIRIAMGIGVGLLIFVAAAVSEDILNSWGVWVALLFISLFTFTTLVLAIRDARRHPATEQDEES